MDIKSSTFLVVEDNIMMQRMIVSALRSLGYLNIHVANDGLEAWEVLRAENIDIILSDLMMPKVDGLQLLSMVRESDLFWNIPFIMITSEARKSKVMYSTEDEIEAYIVKPIVVDKLGLYIEKVLKNRYSPDSFHAAVNDGKTFLRQGDKKEAMESFRQAVLHNPDKSTPYFYLGEILEEFEQDDEAIKCYQKCDDVSNSLYVKSFDGLSRIYMKKQDYAQAADVLKKAVEVSPANQERSILLGECCYKIGDIVGAKQSLLDAAEMADGDEKAIEEIAQICFDHDLLEDAESILRMTYSQDVREQKVYNQFGLMAKEKGQYEKAKTYYNEALKISPNCDYVNYNIAVLYIELENFLVAKAHIKRALKHHPEFQAGHELMEKLEEYIEADATS